MISSLTRAATLLVLATFASAQRALTPAQMEEDLFQLTEKFETLHPGLLRYATRDEIDEAFGEALFQVAEGRTTLGFYRIVSQLAEKGVSFKVIDDPSIDTSSRTGKLVMGILALIAEFENDIRRERQMDGIKKARERGTRFGRKPLLVAKTIQQVRKLRKAGKTVPEIMRQTKLSKASVYRALSA